MRYSSRNSTADDHVMRTQGRRKPQVTSPVMSLARHRVSSRPSRMRGDVQYRHLLDTHPGQRLLKSLWHPLVHCTNPCTRCGSLRTRQPPPPYRPRGPDPPTNPKIHPLQDMIFRFTVDLNNCTETRGPAKSRSNNVPPAAADALSKGSSTSPSCTPTTTPPPSGASTNSRPSDNSSPPAHGYHQRLLPAE
jgi:hypothetical protein